MKTINRLAKCLAAVLTLYMALCLIALPATAETEGDYTYSVSGEYAIVTDYTGTDTELEIPSSLGGYPVSSIAEYTFHGCESLVSIIIPDTITYFDPFVFDFYVPTLYTNRNSAAALAISNASYSFSDPAIPYLSFCISDAETDIRTFTITDCASDVTEIVIPDFVSIIDHYAFSECYALTNIVIPDSVTSIGWDAFWQCTSLSSLVIPDNVAYIGYEAFDDCPATLYTSFNSSAALALGNAGYSFCDPSIPSFSFHVRETADGTPCFSVQSKASNATEIIIPDFVNGISYQAFQNHTSLACILIPDSVYYIDELAFEGCIALTEITIPASVTDIAADAFSGCSDLTVIAPAGSAAQAMAEDMGFVWQAM